MAHKIGAEFDLAHGLANALLISNVIRYNAADVPTKQTAFSQYDRPKSVARYAEIARYLGLEASRDHERVEKLIEWVDELKRTLGIPASIQAAGVAEADFLAKVPAGGSRLRRSVHRRQPALSADQRTEATAAGQLLRSRLQGKLGARGRGGSQAGNASGQGQAQGGVSLVPGQAARSRGAWLNGRLGAGFSGRG